MLEKFPEVISLEDPFHYQDWGAFSSLTEEIGLNVQVGFDLFVLLCYLNIAYNDVLPVMRKRLAVG